ncbi:MULTISPECIES: dihydrolipoyl dehydrogenase [unclassified Leptospira]|uniref:dihydrolipoyl dehydrogenase n=1 Tax=unclassified Leptospira TaxID=2633828 RepID=UPI0002BD7BCD|nr:MULTISPECIES: dihydrolipoyl dehydrogenase [unclassified Leptospira]EMK02061.1 pyridine nucleotide-disulfide oxidoreductase [Leptospira sp. B5-022]MCR1794339.1 dihydrolipoyl dehydrogenase [Leptospira sp. id769339]
MKKYDILVIGSGGGTKLVTPPSKLGYKVAILEKDRLGGTCLNRGCIPSKMLIHPAEILAQAKEASKFQLGIPGPFTVDFKTLVERISATVDADSDSIIPAYEKNPNIDFYPYEGRFVENKVVKVNGELLTADRIFIAAGCRPSIPDLPGLAGTPYMTSREALRRTELPKKLLVLGGGYIGLELGFAYSAFGSKTTFIVRKRMLSHEDKDIIDGFEKAFSKREDVRLGTEVKKVDYQNGIFRLECKNSKETYTLEGDALLIATGIKPNTDWLDLQNTDIQTDEKGYIKTNEYLETTADGVYAMGDINGKYFFRHSVNFEGEFLFNSLYVEKHRTPVEYPPVPHSVFTHPQVAAVGKTEQQLKEEGIEYISAINPYSSSATGMARLSEDQFVKILVSPKSRKILGAHILGEEASNLIHLFILLMTMGGTLEDLLKMIYVHPALPEIARNAARKAKEILSSS